MSDKQYLRNAGIHSAVIIDDGYDETPQVEELSLEYAWESFFDDIYGEAQTRIEKIFPDFNPEDREELKRNQNFIDALWQEREAIRDLLGELFDSYEQKIGEIKPFLEEVESALDELGIYFKKCGRNFVEDAINADLIVLDLFLGIQQGENERQLTVNQLKETFSRRGDRDLPSIVLMSQVPGIDELAKDFRRDVKLHASAFRHIRKKDLPKSGRMKGLILTLASHRSDSQALAKFVEVWEANAIEAVHEAAGTLRKIDIDDLQHIRNMLLRFEGLNTSSYILDVFDRVLQYEIESHSDVLDAAVKLDEVADDPAPLMISNDRDTYALLEQTLFVNPRRREHTTGAEWPIAFGDILGPRPGVKAKPRGLFSGREDKVFFVASPECDLIRKDGLTTALLMSGSLTEIDMTRPGLGLKGNTTPIIVFDDGKRYQVTWDFGDLRTMSFDQAKSWVQSKHAYASIIARLREGSSLNLRQQLLSSLGRVGELAPLPRSLRFRADIQFPLQAGGTEPIIMPEGVEVTGNVIIPRHGKFATMILDSNCEEDLTEVLLNLDLDNVARKSKRHFEYLKEQNRIRQMFRSGLQGISLPVEKYRTAGLLKIGQEQPTKDGDKPKVDPVATVLEASEQLPEGAEKSAGLILRVHIEDDM